MPLAVVGVAAVGTVLVIGGIKTCGSKGKPIAELTEILAGDAQKSIKTSEWMSAIPGDGFRTDDAVRTSSSGAARLRFHNGAVLRLGPATTLRFGQKLSLIGEIQNESAGATTLELDGEQNNVKLGSGAKIRIREGGAGGSLELLVGSAIVTSAGTTTELKVGQSVAIQVDIGGGVVTTIPPEIDAGPPPADAAPPIDAAPVAAAVVATVSGRGVKVKDTADAKARKLTAGDHELPAGAVISVKRRSKVTFARGPEAAELSGTASATVGAVGEPLISVSRGRVNLSGRERSTTIAVPGGRVVARQSRGQGSNITVSVGSKSTITPKRGRVSVISAKANETIQIGEKITLSRNGDISVLGRQPKVADFTVAAGASASIHDPGAPTALRVRFEDKCTDGVVEWKAGRTTRVVRGNGSATILLKPGSHRYKVRCYVDGDLQAASVASGRFKVDRSSGTKPIPAKPPHNIIDATGEKVEIRYQNLLPHVTIRWPNAKADGRYKLHLKRSSAAAKVYATKGPSHKVKNLSEGTYRFWFEGNGTRSKEGLLTISFDNAATSGYLRRPRVGGSWGSGQILVEGAGVRGTKVSARGVRLPLDGQHRFKVSVERPNSEDALAVKFVSPRQGTHYYVRRNGRR